MIKMNQHLRSDYTFGAERSRPSRRCVTPKSWFVEKFGQQSARHFASCTRAIALVRCKRPYSARFGKSVLNLYR